MYSNLKSVLILIAMLKEMHVKNVVCSAGNSHNSILRSLEEDDFFKTYSIVDERSAAFFACGLSQQLQEPVAICCTSGTAASNYLSGVTEASRRKLQLVVITADKNPYYLGQGIDQMIDQPSIFKAVTRYSCTLPMIKNKQDEWYCNRILNEAFLEMSRHGCGPIHINVPIEQGMSATGSYFTKKELPVVNVIERFDFNKNKIALLKKLDALQDKKVLFLCGQAHNLSKRYKQLVETVFDKYNCVFATDKLSNLHCRGTLEITRASSAMEGTLASLRPDIVISIEGNTAIDFKFRLKSSYLSYEHWVVNEEGKVTDTFERLTTVIEASAEQLLAAMDEAVQEKRSSHEYFTLWKEQADKLIIPDFAFSDMYTMQQFMRVIPKGSILNLGNSMTIRISHYFDLDSSIEVFCNRGVNGIDGCVSTFIGQSAVTDKKSFLVVGDLTFFYDMNGLWNRYLGKNIRILLNNNGGAALFNYVYKDNDYPSLDKNVAAAHNATAKGWAQSLGMEYITAGNKEEFDVGLQKFVSDSDKPIMFEVFTDKKIDAKAQLDFRSMNTPFSYQGKLKKTIKTVLGQELLDRLRKK